MSIQKDIYSKLKNAIIYGELSPGEKLSEVELAKSFNTSRTPIREAFRQLQMEGYISVVPNKGAHVSKLPPEEIGEVYDIISLLEGHAAGLAAVNIENSELKDLERLQRKMAVYALKKKFRDYVEENTKFHHLIACLSGNHSLAKTITMLRTRIYRYRLTSVTIPGYLEKYVSDHEKIIDSMAKRDSVRSRKYMREHVDYVKDVLVNFLKQNLTF